MLDRIEGLAGKLTISRRSDDRIYIQIRDEASLNRFVEVELTPKLFGLAVTGMAEVDCRFGVSGLDVVGLQKQTERRRVVCPLKSYDRALLRKWLLDNCSEDGWHIDGYLGSQGSVVSTDEGSILNYHVFRYVPKAGDP